MYKMGICRYALVFCMPLCSYGQKEFDVLDENSHCWVRVETRTLTFSLTKDYADPASDSTPHLDYGMRQLPFQGGRALFSRLLHDTPWLYPH